jgi:hypothetical protein
MTKKRIPENKKKIIYDGKVLYYIVNENIDLDNDGKADIMNTSKRIIKNPDNAKLKEYYETKIKKIRAVRSTKKKQPKIPPAPIIPVEQKIETLSKKEAERYINHALSDSTFENVKEKLKNIEKVDKEWKNNITKYLGYTVSKFGDYVKNERKRDVGIGTMDEVYKLLFLYLDKGIEDGRSIINK